MKFNINGSDVAAPHNMSVHGQKWFNIFMQSLYNTFMPSMSPDTYARLLVSILSCCYVVMIVHLAPTFTLQAKHVHPRMMEISSVSPGSSLV